MALFSKRPSFSRAILPILAIAGLIAAVIFIATGQPDRALEEPERRPPSASGDLANAAKVAGVGVVEPSSEVIDIGTSLPGLITDLRVQPGDYVEKGLPLFVVDGRALRARSAEARSAIGEARAAIAEAQTGRDTAQRQLALYRNIDDPAAVSQSEIIRAEGDVTAANARLQSARSRLTAAQARSNSIGTDLARLTVRAPIAGEILAVNIRPGEFVQSGGPGGSAPIIQMGQTSPLHVRIDVDEDEAVRVALGSPAQVSPRGDAASQVNAEFVRVEPQIVPKRSLTNTSSERVDVRVMQIIYRLPDTDGVFRVGQQVDAFIGARATQTADTAE